MDCVWSEEGKAMVVCCVFCLFLTDGRRLYVRAENRVVAFERMRQLWPLLVEGYCHRDLICI